MDIAPRKGTRQTGKTQKASAFTLIEMMIVVLIIGILVAMGVANLTKARETTYRKSCIANLNRLQYAKDSYMMDYNKAGDSPAGTFTDDVLFGVNGYINVKPLCPGGGAYSINDGNLFPTCDYGDGTIHIIGE